MTAKVDFKVINLKIINDLIYELSLDESYSNFNNSYLWNYIQRDILAVLLKDSSVCVEIFDSQKMEILKGYLDKLYTFSDTSNEKVYIFCEKADLRLLTELIEGTDTWSYAGLLKIYACQKGYFSDDSIKINDLDYYFKIEPFGDNLGISISVNKELGTPFKEAIIERIQSVTDAYKLELKICREGEIC